MDGIARPQIIDGWRIGWVRDGTLMNPERGFAGLDGPGLIDQLAGASPNRLGPPRSPAAGDPTRSPTSTTFATTSALLSWDPGLLASGILLILSGCILHKRGLSRMQPFATTLTSPWLGRR